MMDENVIFDSIIGTVLPQLQPSFIELSAQSMCVKYTYNRRVMFMGKVS